MEQFSGMRIFWLGSLLGMFLAQETLAGVIATGDVSPNPVNPLFIVGGRLHVGKDAPGTMLVDGGTLLQSLSGTLGRESGGRGEVTITGAGSNGTPTTWDSTFASPSPASMTIGRHGVGILNVLDGGRLLSGHGRIAAELEGSGEVRLDGLGTEWINTGITVGQRALGILTITGGAVATSDGAGRIGDDSQAEGQVTVSGKGSSWSNTEFLVVGDEGKGTLGILEGAVVDNAFAKVGSGAGATGEVTVDGEGSTWTNRESLRIGSGGTGTLAVTGGGRVTSVGFVSLGVLVDASGEATVDGVDSIWEHEGDFLVGDAGTGVLHITAGGQVHNAQGEVGFTPGSVGTVTVNGEGSAWSNSEDLFVGNFGDGTLDITTAGRVDAGTVVIGLDGSGRVEVLGEDSFFEIRNNLALGGVPDDPPGSIPVGVADGTGEMLIAERARVEVGTLAALGVGPASEGTLTVISRGRFEAEEGLVVALGDNSRGTLLIDGRGSRVELEGDLSVAIGEDSEGTVTLAGGTLDMHGNDILVGQGTAHFNLTDGRLRHVGRFGLDLDQLGGILAAGNSPGTMIIGGDYTKGENATLELELAGLGGQAGVDFDYYEVEGVARLAGMISVLADGDFSLAQSASFDFLTATTIDITGLTIDAPVGATLGVFAGANGGQVLRLTLLVPEPISVTLLLVGCLVVVGRGKICHYTN